MAEDPLTYLASAAAHGDDGALRDLIRATQGDVARLCAHLGSPADAEDLTQDTFVRVLRALPTFRGDAPVRAWILAIARHVCADYVRSRRRRRPLDARAARRTEQVVDGAGTELFALVDALDDERRTAFVLTQIIGMSYEEAAMVCGCPVGTIRSRVARARAQLAAGVWEAEAV